mmetsp:Transcript_20172/g.29945  ORF Transcript_20172/g.29945 Transcript_20172/m.29945 type:complete len:201 (-) Transcript_20172:60-662(-)
MCNLCSPIYCIPIALGWEKGPNNDDDDQDDFTISTVISENTKRVPNEKPRRCSEMIRRCFLSSSKVETEEETPTKEDERTIQPPVLEPELDLAYAGETIRWQADDEEEEKDRAPFCFICLEDFAANPKIVKSKCSRSYHRSCMLEWVKEKNKTCPDCQASIWDHIEFEGLTPCKYDVVPAYSGNLHNLRRSSVTNNPIRY